jgi:hypothetical protein
LFGEFGSDQFGRIERGGVLGQVELFAIGKEDLHGNLFRGQEFTFTDGTNALNLPSDAGSRPGKRTGTHVGRISRRPRKRNLVMTNPSRSNLVYAPRLLCVGRVANARNQTPAGVRAPKVIEERSFMVEVGLERKLLGSRIGV